MIARLLAGLACAAFMALMPFAVAYFSARGHPRSARIVVIGALAFIASQIVHIPLLVLTTWLAKKGIVAKPPEAWTLVINSVFLGLAAGVCEEVARWVAMRRFMPDQRTFRDGFVFGAGHGGVESMLLGGLSALSVVGMFVSRNETTESLIKKGATPEKAAAAMDQIHKFWSSPLHLFPVGAFERCCAVTCHIAMAVLVMRAVARRSPVWLLLAILFHSALDGLAVYASKAWGIAAAEGVGFGFAVLAVLTLIALREKRALPS